MGYWEQIGEANIRHRERRAKMHPRHRAIFDAIVNASVVTVSAMLWAMLFVPFGILVMSLFGR